MPSLIHIAHADAVAAARIETLPRGIARPRRHRPPPIRRHVAYAVRRVRRAVA